MLVVLLRTVIIYIIIVIALRIMGKRQLGELQPSELVVTILVSNIATLSIEDTNIPLLGSILPIFSLVCCEVIVSVIILKSPRLRKIITGNPRILIRDGTIDQSEMKNLRWSIEDLMEQLRANGTFDISEVSFAVVETSGSLSVYPKYKSRPATPEVLDLPDREKLDTPPVVIVSDGVVAEDAMRFCNLDRKWLEKTLRKQGLQLSDIFLMSCNRSANYHIYEKEGGRGK